jgi:hypothetical protein
LKNPPKATAYTERGFHSLCQCSASRFFQNTPSDVVDLLQSGYLTHQRVQIYQRQVLSSCTETIASRQRSLPPGTLLIPNESSGNSLSPRADTASQQDTSRRFSIDGAVCSVEANGLIKCNNGVVCMRDSSGLIRCNNGLNANTDSSGLTRFSDGTSATTDQGGLTRYSNGRSSITDQSGLTRFSDGTYCTRDASGLTRCNKPRGTLD